jgi:hypothetical protein
MKNWKTTLAGGVTALAGFVLFSPGLFVRWPWAGEIAKYVMAEGLASMGLAGKDFNSHSTVAETQDASFHDQAR